MDLTTLERLPLWIGGNAVAAQTKRYGEITNPATGEVIRHVPLANAADIDAAVTAAAAALPGWRVTPSLRRARILMRFRDLMDSHRKDLAKIITQEHGKTHADAEGEVTRGIEVIEFATGIPHLLKGEFSENVGTEVDSFSLRQPVGVCAGITPFNFPAMVPLWMFPVAIACGNTFVLKPSERDPTLSIRMAELLKEAGLPDGVFNVVHGDKESVDALLAHPTVKAISFVGSTPIAKYIYETGARNGKRVQALGGAKNHAVVLPDADLSFATEAIIGAGYGSAGERCMAISAIVAVGEAADPLIERLAERARRVTVGPGDAPNIEMGPVITCAARDRIAGYIDRGVEEGARLVVDGRGLSVAGHADGFLRRAHAVRSCHAGDGDLPRRDIRAGAFGRAGGVAHRRHRTDQQQSLRQRHGDLHALRSRGAPLPAGRGGRHDRRQRADPRADGVLFVRRVAFLVVR
jgi:malonate-semialdehyde dehydrogenase (acetylating)/methylmalonate-semialdehyde dehydrogenase